MVNSAFFIRRKRNSEGKEGEKQGGRKRRKREGKKDEKKGGREEEKLIDDTK